MVLNMLGKLTKTSQSENSNAITPTGAKTLQTISGMRRSTSPGDRIQVIDPSAMKTDLFSRHALDFINSAGTGLGTPYNEQQLLGAYMTSVYMYAALRRISNLISRVKIVAEIERDNKFVRAPENTLINQIFAKDGGQVMSRMWLNYAIYGASVTFKTKTRRAITEEQRGHPIFRYDEGAVGGLYVLDKPMWSLDDSFQYSNDIRGLHVNQYPNNEIIGDRSYLDRDEFVYVTNWNPEDPNRGKSIVAVAIHEAVANASIAQWMAEYFTRGAMPFILVSMEDDPELITDSDLLKYKRQFEEYWQGMSSSLRSIFFDRKVNVEQVGIPADEVAAPDLNAAALEGISAAVGLDRELIVTPDNGSQERHALLIKRAWEDTVIPIAESFLEAFNHDLGLPPGMRLVLDLSEIAELEADREDKSGTEISIYESGLQTYNETRTRLSMPPVSEFDGWYMYDGKPVPLEQILATASVPNSTILDYSTTMWDSNLLKRSEVLSLLGRTLPEGVKDGYKIEIEGSIDLITSLWGDDLLTRAQVLNFLGYTMPDYAEDGYRSELERGADYGEYITGLWSDNLLTRKQTIQLLDMGLDIPENMVDGYADEIGDRKSNIFDYWDKNLIKRKKAMSMLGLQEEIDNEEDGFQNEVDAKTEARLSEITQRRDNLISLWGENLITRGQIMEALGVEIPDGTVEGFQNEVDIISEALANKRAGELTGTPPDDGGGGGGGSWRSILREPRKKQKLDVTRGAEEDKLENYGKYPDDPLVGDFYGPQVEVLPDEWIPVDESYQESWVNDPDVYTDETGYNLMENVRGHDYYDSIAASATVEDLKGHNKRNASRDFQREAILNHWYVEKLADEELNAQLNKELDELIDEELSQFENAMFNDIFGVNPDISPLVEFDIEEVDSLIESDQIISDESPELYIGLWFGASGELTQLQKLVLDSISQQVDVELQETDTFHLTLAYAPSASDDAYKKVLDLLPSHLSPIKLKVNHIGTFDNEDSRVIWAGVEESLDLRQLQQKIAMAFNAQGIGLSPFSDPGSFNPHITLMYVPQGTVFTPPDNLEFTLEAKFVSIGRDGYDIVDHIPFVAKAHQEPDGVAMQAYISNTERAEQASKWLKIKREALKANVQKYINDESSYQLNDALKLAIREHIEAKDILPATFKAIDDGHFDSEAIKSNPISVYLTAHGSIKAEQDNALTELAAWRRATLKNGVTKGIRFESQNIPTNIVSRVKSALNELSSDIHNPDKIRGIFEDAFNVLKKDNKHNG